MALMRPTPDVMYIERWLETATNGNVVMEQSFLECRIRLHCTKCDTSLTLGSDKFIRPTVPYDAQEFVEIHAHRGGHTRSMPGDHIPMPPLADPEPKQKTGRRFR